jgi:SAM-dependent methyltransferase
MLGAMSEHEAAGFWDGLYGERDRIWSGAVNTALADVAGGLEPGAALDLGYGEGGDTLWLAERGWRVMAVDVSATAVERARAAARDRGVGDDRVTWLVTDLATWRPSEDYDLVSVCFLHSPVAFPRTVVLRRAAGSVARGGHLLLVGHAEPPPWAGTGQHEGHHPALLGPAEEVTALGLDETAWHTVVAEPRTRAATGPDGEQATLTDSVVLLRRR